MLTEVVLETTNPTSLKILDADPEEILIVTSISGLSPADVTLFTGDFARDGGYYQGRRVQKRNPVFNFKLNPDYAQDIDVSDVRDILYRQFLEPSPNQDGVQMRFIDDRRPDRYLIGYTEKIETELFAKDQIASVSTLCVDPYFKAVAEVLQEDSAGWVSTPVNYDGSADTGLEISLRVTVAGTQVTVSLAGKTMTLIGTFAQGDIIRINTVIGQRAVQKNSTDVMGYLTAASQWLYLSQESSTLSATNAVITSYRYRSAWWGL